jgi:transposase
VPCRCCPGGVSRSTRVPRYPSDMSDAEWQVIEPALPAPAWQAGQGGRPAGWCRRDIIDAIRYLVQEGIRWRAMPCDFPPWQTVYDVLDCWEKSGAAEAVHGELREQCRVAAGRLPGPSAAVIDSQSVKAAETVPRSGRGFDAGKKVNGRKRHIAVDTIGLLLTVLVTAAGTRIGCFRTDTGFLSKCSRAASADAARARASKGGTALPTCLSICHSLLLKMKPSWKD